MSATSARLLVITNAAAGTNEDEVLEPALEAMRQRADVKVAATASPDELAEVLAQLDGRQVVVAGGDGSLHAVVQALYDTGLLHRTAVSLLPLGTGNDFARGMGIPLDTLAAVAVVLDGDLRPVDLITDNEGRIVINNVHAGVSAQASRHGARWKQRLGSVNLGKVGYPVGAALEFYKAIQQTYGFTSMVPTPGFWGPTPPTMIGVEISEDETVQIPWG